MNDIQSMRNINRNLFDVPASANALEEYDSDVAQLVREAAAHLFKARRDKDGAALNEAYNLTLIAASDLMKGAGSSVYVRTHVMVTTRLVELEAALLAAEAKTASE
ncbi:hypothetical protein [Streptomyces pseudovenezuelae]|uniref:Cell division protein ZapA n=1 Tax=Streptomyces pseudovenezuelae TaxID=67350 RepID=A0ABT6LCQ5_9ACTN|nr:hypothetical protein [Streptomyces pseudovenezuelae]MDH6214072.1 hypothetical protein [Streptomyces pseudovenezuelae]